MSQNSSLFLFSANGLLVSARVTTLQNLGISA